MLAQSLSKIAEVTIRKAFVRTCTLVAPAERLFELHTMTRHHRKTQPNMPQKKVMASFVGAGANKPRARSRKRSVSHQLSSDRRVPSLDYFFIITNIIAK